VFHLFLRDNVAGTNSVALTGLNRDQRRYPRACARGYLQSPLWGSTEQRFHGIAARGYSQSPLWGLAEQLQRFHRLAPRG
jgi:hypothetical protein